MDVKHKETNKIEKPYTLLWLLDETTRISNFITISGKGSKETATLS